MWGWLCCTGQRGISPAYVAALFPSMDLWQDQGWVQGGGWMWFTGRGRAVLSWHT
jgi:hypothetical protein